MLFLFILQNAYQSDKYNFKNNQEWHRDLLRSHTGKRLSEMIPDGVEVRVINASPTIGDNADSCYTADAKHILKMVKKFKPNIICACGRVAEQGCIDAEIKHIVLPHPAYRALSKIMTQEIKHYLSNMAGE